MSVSYQALYRTYRPKQFNEVVGQEVIVKTLQNALLHNKVSHAYLFNGPRGTGKTTIAKILAKAVNCEIQPNNEPCGKCRTCLAIEEGSISDVIEIDAASNTGVDDMRNLLERVNYMPSLGRYKVYIIDEVHMLTMNAFNALLKTLEEPPAHVLFILATTEINKVIPTIQSRCQRFDFRGITIKDIEKKLFEIKEKEKINITDEAVREIAKQAEGGLRDAISTFDQAISFSGDIITIDDVHKVSGSVSRTNLLDLLSHIHDKRVSNALTILNSIIEDGKEVHKIVADLISIYRDILVEKNAVFDVQKTTDYLKDIASKISNDRLYFYLDILNDTQNAIKYTNQKRTFLELAIIKMIDHQQLDQINQNEHAVLLMNRINALELEIRKLKENPPVQTVIKTSVDSVIVEDEVDEPIHRKEITVEMIENILNNGDVQKRKHLQNHWGNLKNIKDSNLQSVASILHHGKLAACSEKEALIVYPDKMTCQMMLRPQNKQSALDVFNAKQKQFENIVCIDEASWNILESAYIKAWKSGDKKPSLPKLTLDIYETQEESWQPDTVKLALDFFGEDIVTIKE